MNEWKRELEHNPAYPWDIADKGLSSQRYGFSSSHV